MRYLVFGKCSQRFRICCESAPDEEAVRAGCRFVLIVTLLLGLVTSLGAQSAAQAPAPSPDVASKAKQADEVVTLAIAKAVEREIKGGEKHNFQIALAANQFVDALVEQRGVDVVVRLIGQQGEILREVDTPNGTEGPEPISWVTEAAGVYRLEVSPLEQQAKAGRYEVKIVELRAATPRDKDVISAEKAFAEGQQLRLQRKPELLRRATEKFAEALRLWQGLGNRTKEALTLHALGFVYNLLGEQKKALEFYNQALPLRRAVADRGGEAVTLNNIGMVYYSLGDKQKAVDFYNQALPLHRAAHDVSGEAVTLENLGEAYESLGESRKALEFYRQALLQYRAIGARHGEATMLSNMGVVHKSLGDLQQALELSQQALTLFKATGNQSFQAQTLNRIGLIYEALGDKEKALEFYNQALPLRHVAGDSSDEAITLNHIARVYSAKGDKQKALEFYNQALPLSRASGNSLIEAVTLNETGALYDSMGQTQKALDFYKQALPLLHDAGDRFSEANTLLTLATAYFSLGNSPKALEAYNQAATLFHALGKRSLEAAALTGVGVLYSSLNERQKALEALDRALMLARAAGEKVVEAHALTYLGLTYNLQGDKQKALEFYEQALSLHRATGQRDGEALTLNTMAAIHNSRGEKQKALELLSLALPLFHAAGDRTFEAYTHSSMASVYYWLGDKQKALESLNQALPLYRALGSRSGEAFTLNSIGFVYQLIADYKKAREFFEQALPLSRTVGDRLDQAYALLGIGVVDSSEGENQKALEPLEQALAIFHSTGFRFGEAYTLTSIGKANDSLGEKQKALKFFNQALVLSREAEEGDVEGYTLPHLMSLWKSLNRPGLAIFYGKQAINTYQRIRLNIRELDKGLQKGFLTSKEGTYRQLADLLISEGRLPEAQQVLGLLKEEEYFEFVRRDDTTSLTGVRLNFTPAEADLEKRFSEIANHLTAIGAQRDALLAIKDRTPEQEKQLSELEAQLEVANQAFQKFLDQLEAELRQTPRGKDDAGVLRESQALKETLRELDAIALFTIVGQDKCNIILITPDVEKAYVYKISEPELNKKIFAFREVLQNPHADPLPQAQDLYRILIGPELARDIAQTGKQTVLWSLDGSLRYLPMAALHDGQKYLVEGYRNVVITLASRDHLKDPVSTKWQVLGLGVSRGEVVSGGTSAPLTFPPLPGVREELSGIVRDETKGVGQKGVLPGKVMLDEEFTTDAMKTALRLRGNEQPFKLVHIASHFRFEPGDETKSFLLLGGGKTLTLSQLKSMSQIFGRVELLTLSACNTATGGVGAQGKEVEGFAVLAQRQGAEAIIATLWPVSDPSTSQLMQQFYRLRDSHAGMSKAEAMRQAQLALLRGEARQTIAAVKKEKPAQAVEQTRVSDRSSFKTDPQAPFAHPYFWAPFIMIGNWR